MPPFTPASFATGNTSHRSLNHDAHDSANFVSTYYYLYISPYLTTNELWGVKTEQGFSKQNACKAHHLQQYYAMSANVLLLLTVGCELAEGHQEKKSALGWHQEKGQHSNEARGKDKGFTEWVHPQKSLHLDVTSGKRDCTRIGHETIRLHWNGSLQRGEEAEKSG